LRLDQHHSFASANNLATEKFPATTYLLLNNDVLLCPNVLERMLGILDEQENVGICGARMLFPDGTLQHGGVVFGSGNTGPYHHMRGVDHRLAPTADRDHQAVTGACLLVRHSVWALLGGLDESYVFGLEDIDLCLRARQYGWRVVCCNRSYSLHFESMTAGRVELDVDSRGLFMRGWQNRYTVDG
jgi:GT2 family glycosyltransferase